MKQLDGKTGMFYREQTLANLRFLFDSNIDILTCDGESGCVIAFAFQTQFDGIRVKIMQTYAGDVVKALKALHDMSCQRLREFSVDCGNEFKCEHLAKCNIALSMQPECKSESNSLVLSNASDILIDMPLPGEEPENGKPEPHEADDGQTDPLQESDDLTTMLPKQRDNLAESATEISQNDLTPAASVSSHARMREYSVLLDIQYPFQKPVGAYRLLRSPSRQNLLQLLAEVLALNEPPNDPTRFMKSLSIRKGDSIYDILGYPQDDIVNLLDDILESERLIKVECVYSI
ncbi:hypothetical protein AtubIFM54640_010119 [Aspergillus tubingensis]|nr:hypothetical protein AtubIFM54640_010119 [Aspergillus tubingensis]